MTSIAKSINISIAILLKRSVGIAVAITFATNIVFAIAIVLRSIANYPVGICVNIRFFLCCFGVVFLKNKVTGHHKP